MTTSSGGTEGTTAPNRPSERTPSAESLKEAAVAVLAVTMAYPSYSMSSKAFIALNDEIAQALDAAYAKGAADMRERTIRECAEIAGKWDASQCPDKGHDPRWCGFCEAAECGAERSSDAILALLEKDK